MGNLVKWESKIQLFKFTSKFEHQTFQITKMLIIINFSRSWRQCIRKLVTKRSSINLTMTENLKVITGSICKNGFLSVRTDLDLLLFF